MPMPEMRTNRNLRLALHESYTMHRESAHIGKRTVRAPRMHFKECIPRQTGFENERVASDGR